MAFKMNLFPMDERIIPLLHVEQISRDTWQQRNPQGTDADWEAYKAKGLHSSFPNMHPEIGKINWVYFREGIDDFDKSLAGLLELLERHQTYVHQHLLSPDALNSEYCQQEFNYALSLNKRIIPVLVRETELQQIRTNAELDESDRQLCDAITASK